MNLGIGLSLTNFLRVPTVPLEDLDAAIAALFSSGEVGAWYDPSDSTTVFQDAAGTTPATVGDPVGLILDKSQGLTLGSELVTAAPNNGTTYSFDTFATDGVLITAASTSSSKLAGAYWDVGSLLPANTWVKVVITVSVAAGSLVPRIVFVGDTSGAGGFLSNTHTLTSGTHTVFLKTTGPTRYLQIGTGNGLFDFSVSAISAKQLPGNHATQTTSAARPVLQQSGGLYYLDFDGVDDLMVASYGSTLANITRAAGYRMDTVGRFFADDDGDVNYASMVILTDGNLRWGINGAGVGNNITGTGGWNIGTDGVVIATASSGSALTLQGTGTSASGTSTSAPANITGATIGAAATGLLEMNGRIYGFIDIDRILDAAEITSVETYLAAKSGVTLP